MSHVVGGFGGAHAFRIIMCTHFPPTMLTDFDSLTCVAGPSAHVTLAARCAFWVLLFMTVLPARSCSQHGWNLDVLPQHHTYCHGKRFSDTLLIWRNPSQHLPKIFSHFLCIWVLVVLVFSHSLFSVSFVASLATWPTFFFTFFWRIICFNIATISKRFSFLSSSLVEERHGSPARLPVPAPGWGKPHAEVDAQPAHQRHAGRLRPGEEVPMDTSALLFFFLNDWNCKDFCSCC